MTKKRTVLTTKDLELMYDILNNEFIVEAHGDSRNEEKVKHMDSLLSKLYRKINKL